jgi:histone H3/H4
MSKPARQPRTKKSETTAETPVVPTPVQPVVEPVVEPAAAVVETKPTETEEAKPKKADNGITRARVRTHIDKFNLNRLLDSKIEEVRAEAAAKNITPEQVDEYKPYKDRIKALSGERVRFSDGASAVLSIVCEELTEQLLRFAMDKNLELGDGKFVKVHHMHTEGVEQLGLFPLVRTLPMFVSKKTKFDRQYQEQLLNNHIKVAVSAAEKEFKKLHDIKAAKKRPDAAPKEKTEKPPKAPAPKDPSTKTAFKAYVNGVYLALKESNPSYEKSTLSGELKNYLSELLVEFIRRISSHIYLMTTTIKNKTVNDIVTLRAVELLLIDMHQPNETIELKEVDGKYVVEKSVTYPTSGYEKLFAAVEAKREKAKAELASSPEEEHQTA